MIQWLMDNKEWLFSGAGLGLISMLVFVLKSTLLHKEKPQGKLQEEISQWVDDKPNTKNKGHDTIGGRIRHAIALMNRTRHSEVFAMADIANILRLPSTGALEKVIASGNHVDFEFTKHFSETFGINLYWLDTGHGQPFYHEVYSTRPITLFDSIQSADAKGIYFVRDNSEENRVVIVLKLKVYRNQGYHFVILNSFWHISSHVGAAGSRQIFEFYRLILKLKASGLYNKCWGREVTEEQFSRLVSGEIFPGELTDGMVGEAHWWDDFTDISGSYVISEHYRQWYGEWFDDAQTIVRWKLQEQKDNFISYFRELSERHGFVQRAWLFGSRIAGDANPRSDIDVAVQCSQVTATQWEGFVNSLENSVLIKIDIHRWHNMSNDFQSKVQETGDIIYERKKD